MATRLDPITTIAAVPHEYGVRLLFDVRPYLAVLSDRSAFPFQIDASRPRVWNLENLIDEVLNADPEDRPTFLQERTSQLAEIATTLMTLLDADLAHQPVYQLFPKRAYDTASLVQDATQLFAERVRQALTDEERFNIVEAGKCLAFEVPTAAGFHIFRAMDAILQRLVRHETGSLPRNKNWGQYVKALESAGCDPKLTSVITQVKDFHRNPVVHPETRLSVEDALSLVGIVESCISMMILRMIGPEDDNNASDLAG